MTNRARKLLAEVNRWEQRRAEADEALAAAQTELTTIWQKACDRFGRSVPTDAFFLDVLDSIDIEDGEVWRWRGMTNNKGLAVVRSRSGRKAGSEESLVRFLAVAFGIIEPEEFGSLYPANGDPDDINPWHRTLRRSERPLGNPDRFAFSPKVAS